MSFSFHVNQETRKLASTDTFNFSNFKIPFVTVQNLSYKDVYTFRLRYRPPSFTMISSKMIILLLIGATLSSDFFIDIEDSDSENPLDRFLF